MRKIGVLGGSFDPPHNGHLSISQQVLRRLNLEEVILIPAGRAPHKQNVAPENDRLQMCRLAVRGLRGLEVSDVEIRRGGLSYTIDTIRQLRGELGEDVASYFIIGGDTLPELPTWRGIRDLVEDTEWAIVQRPGYPRPDVESVRGRLDDKAVAKLSRSIVRLEDPCDVSSTEIRKRLAAGDDVNRLVRAPVLDYIRQRGLYGVKG